MKAAMLGSILVAFSALATGCVVYPEDPGYTPAPDPTPFPSSYETISQFADRSVASSDGVPGSIDYSAAQALGSPDVGVCSDDPHAWSPSYANPLPGVSPNGDPVDAWLDTGFYDYVWVRQVKIYESYGVGAIVRVDLEATDGSALPLTIFEDSYGDGPAACPSALVINLGGQGTTFQYDHVVIYMDSNLVGDANFNGNYSDDYDSIDAVELVGDVAI